MGGLRRHLPKGGSLSNLSKNRQWAQLAISLSYWFCAAWACSQRCKNSPPGPLKLIPLPVACSTETYTRAVTTQLATLSAATKALHLECPNTLAADLVCH